MVFVFLGYWFYILFIINWNAIKHVIAGNLHAAFISFQYTPRNEIPHSYGRFQLSVFAFIACNFGVLSKTYMPRQMSFCISILSMRILNSFSIPLNSYNKNLQIFTWTFGNLDCYVVGSCHFILWFCRSSWCLLAYDIICILKVWL